MGRNALFIVLTLALSIGAGRWALDGYRGHAHERVRAALDAAGHRWVELEVRGRRGHLSGHAPSTGFETSAAAVALGASCRLAGISVRCLGRIEADFGAPHLAWPEMTVSIERDILTLSGHVPDDATHGVVLAQVRKAVKEGRIRKFVDELELLDRGTGAGVDRTAGRVAELATLCDDGEARLTEGVLSVRCTDVPNADLLAEVIARPLPAGSVGVVDVAEGPSGP